MFNSERQTVGGNGEVVSRLHRECIYSLLSELTGFSVAARKMAFTSEAETRGSGPLRETRASVA